MNINSKNLYNSYMNSHKQFTKNIDSICLKKIPIEKPIPPGYKKVGIATDKDYYLY